MQGVALNPFSYPHYTDHLAPICIIMDIPLILTDAEHECLAKRYYPGLKTQLEEWQTITPDRLAAHYDLLFSSDLWSRQQFRKTFEPFEKKYRKTIRYVHCPHGFSDKKFWLEKCAFEDISLIYGNKMLDLLKERGVFDQLNNYVITGNYRYTYYRKNRLFFDPLIQQEVFNRFSKQQTTILYAPTWKDEENSTSFFDAAKEVLSQLPPDYNLIVKLHPNLEQNDPIQLYSIIGEHENRPNVLFLKDFPLIFPLLARTDIYLGDLSSIGYDFLIFNKPMFFLTQNTHNKKHDLYQSGIAIAPEDYHNIFSIMNKNLLRDQQNFSKIRAKTYEYTFGHERSFNEIQQEIVKLLKS